ncbi:hypothetical protein Glove_352g51 [Diversispora epigaea]|uniref:Uncharacterized protein n=1 Tax=Diversispora epigaea TaxID=1348612 RepID=A0A397HBP1_9GLOM|nr:hypothetical protein Glove_352g51 [Diversispora epigaea]
MVYPIFPYTETPYFLEKTDQANFSSSSHHVQRYDVAAICRKQFATVTSITICASRSDIPLLSWVFGLHNGG